MAAGIRIDPQLLWRLGYRQFTRQQVDEALTELYEALEYAVGGRIAAQLNKRQLDEFEKLLSSGTDERALVWLENAVPAYKHIVSDEFATLERRLEGAISLVKKQRTSQRVEER